MSEKVEVYIDSEKTEPAGKSIEESFVGLKYVKCTGLIDSGKPKNVYTESYADSNKTRTYIPKKVLFEPRDIELTLIFIDVNGSSRYKTYDSFFNFINKGVHTYEDRVRSVKVDIMLTSEVKVSEEVFTGNIPYIEATFKFTTVHGSKDNKEVTQQ